MQVEEIADPVGETVGRRLILPPRGLLVRLLDRLGDLGVRLRRAPCGFEILGVRDHLRDAVLVQRGLDQRDQLLGSQRVQFDPAGPQERDLFLGRAAFAQALVANLLQVALADRLVFEPATGLASPPRASI